MLDIKKIKYPQYNYDKVRSWSKKLAGNTTLFEMDKVYCPVYYMGHWILIVIKWRKKQYKATVH